MAPTSTVRTKVPKTKSPKVSRSSSKPGAKGPTSSSRVSKKSKLGKAPPPKQQKTKSAIPRPKRKKWTYTDKELGIPKLNMITPVGVEAPKGKKKGKVFVDDTESLMTILAIVNANKEGQIESKMMKSRHMEEIREARKSEAEKRTAERKGKFEATKDSMRKKRKRGADDAGERDVPGKDGLRRSKDGLRAGKKRVSFA